MSPAAHAFTPVLWSTLAGVARLQGHAFLDAIRLHDGEMIAVIIVLLAGISQALAQSFVLFANRVSPKRFLMCLLTSAVLFAFGYLFYAASTWVVARFTGAHLSLRDLCIVLAISYVPFFFSIFEAVPYVGVAIMWVLRVWQLLAMIVGIAVVAHVSLGEAFMFAGLGWLALGIAQQTFGKPIGRLGTFVMDAVAGETLQVDEDAAVEDETLAPSLESNTGGSSTVAASPTVHGAAKRASTIAYVTLVVVLFGLVLVLARPLQSLIFGWSAHLPAMLRLPFNLVWIAVVGLLAAAILTPLETLGWWAGWFGEDITPTTRTVKTAAPFTRYVVYLDGIAQSGSSYTVDVEKFLDALEPTFPGRVKFIRGLMVYSAFNRPLDDEPVFSAFWKFIEKTRLANPASVLGLFVNIRNIVIVGVSTDPRYGPIYNYGIARVLYDGLLANGYVPRSGVPITLIGYSGGAQMAAGAAGFLRRALETQIDLVTLGGVMSGSGQFMDLGHVYHQVGDKDSIQRLGLFLFPSRWKAALLSKWNRAMRLGRISTISLGPVGHMEPGGMFDASARLPDGRTHLQQTLDNISSIVQGHFTVPALPPARLTNYGFYVKAAWNRPEYYPIGVSPTPDRYVPLARWMGRLILPQRDERHAVQGAWFEVHHTDAEHQHLVGQRVKLRWSNDPLVRKRVSAVTRDVFFSPEAEYSSTTGGTVCPTRVNQWQLVDPLESLAGSRPLDDVFVMLTGNIDVVVDVDPVIQIDREPVQVSGTHFGLARFIRSESNGEQYRIAHFNRVTDAFDGPEEVVAVPKAEANPEGRAPSSMRNIEDSPLNRDGFYLFGALDQSGTFVVRAIAPRAMLSAAPRKTLGGAKEGYRFVRKVAWADLLARKGTASSVAVDQINAQTISDDWKEGDRALLIHVFGGVGGKQREAAANGSVYLGHFAYGEARVIRDPLSGELRFDVVYYQIYAHNEDGLVSGAHHWSRYMGDRQFGWLGERPVCDIMLRHDGFTSDFTFEGGREACVLEALAVQLEVMAQRYRIANGSGCAYVGPANNCAQDSNRALFAVLTGLQQLVKDSRALASWQEHFPRQAERYERLARLIESLRGTLQTFGGARRDWTSNEFSMGSTLEDHPFQQIVMALGSWRMALPRFASDTIAKTFLDHGASARVLFYDQVGGLHPEIEPIAPLTL